MAIVLGRLWSELVKGLALSAVMVLVSLPFGVRVKSGVLGFVVLTIMIALWAMVFSGFMQLIALKTRSAAATQSAGLVFFPLLFLTPNFVPRALLTHPMQIAARLNPVTYIMEGARSLILDGFVGQVLARSFAVIAGSAILMMALCVRVINRYD